jgi:hypothetical protein
MAGSPHKNPIFSAHLRIARPTRSIAALLPFYTTGLGFKVISSFQQHAGFDGLMLGHPSLPYHLEFTTQEGHEPGRAPTEDNLLVFYIPECSAWKNATARMESAGFVRLRAGIRTGMRMGKGRRLKMLMGGELCCGMGNGELEGDFE